MIQLDTFLTIGKQHRVCEDYILSGMTPMPYIILSDGCSSAKKSDVGSRILCHIAEKLLKELLSYEPYIHGWDFGKAVVQRSRVIADQFELDPTSLDATLIVCFYDNSTNTVQVHMFGDGHVFLFNDDHVFEYFVKFEPNAPNYLSYELSSTRKQLYHNMQVKKSLFVKSNSGVDCQNESWTNFPISLLGFKGALKCTDGIDSLLSVEGKVNTIDAAKVFTSFKTTGGEFLKRRSTAALKNYKLQNIENYDDLSMGCFLMGE